MLALPTKGISRSINVHNVDLDVLCDWIEGSVLFVEDELSQTDIVDALIGEGIYTEQDMALEIVCDAWTEIRRRQSWVVEGTPFAFRRSRISRVTRWSSAPAYSFCLLLSLAKLYRYWAQSFGADYTEQGELFEELTKESLTHQFHDWKIFLTGWSRKRTTQIKTLVEEIALRVGESVGNVPRWTSERQKDAELDMLCYRPFRDGRVGVPVFLMQCASGVDWKTKVNTPQLKVWKRIVEFVAEPKRAFATPFAMDNRRFERQCNLVDGLFLDRYRILAAVIHRKRWIPPDLRSKLVAWSKPRVRALPRRDN